MAVALQMEIQVVTAAMRVYGAVKKTSIAWVRTGAPED
jgi:hypothetical protein